MWTYKIIYGTPLDVVDFLNTNNIENPQIVHNDYAYIIYYKQ